MPVKTGQRAEVNSFVQGLITEASSLNFPANASLDEINFELNRNGTRRRRLGMDFENNYALRGTELSFTRLDGDVINHWRWKSVDGNPNLDFLVIQFERKLMFFHDIGDNISNDGYLGEILLDELPLNTRYSAASSEGSFIVVGNTRLIAIVSYNQDTGAFTTTYDAIRIRDQFGVQTSNPQFENDLLYRGPNEPNHYYNLQNQGWGIPRRASTENNTIRLADPVQVFQDHNGSLAPSNSESVWTAMQYQAAANAESEPVERIYPGLWTDLFGSAETVSKGYFIIDALTRGVSRRQQWDNNLAKHPELLRDNANPPNTIEMPFNPPEDRTHGGPRCVVEHAGRIFYSGFTGEVSNPDERSPNYSNFIFFSQLIKNKQDFTKCFQENDPTARDINDVLDTDGGFLKISEAKNIKALVNLGSSLIVLAANGVWTVQGGNDYGFTATNYRVDKISNFGCLSDHSVIVGNNQGYFWSVNGICAIGRNQFGDYEVVNMTETTIQTYYDNIPMPAKNRAFGVYDELGKKLRWMYRESATLTNSADHTYELIFDMVLGAWYPYRIENTPSNRSGVLCGFQLPVNAGMLLFDPVMAGNAQVLVGDAVVMAESQDREITDTNVGYLIVHRGTDDQLFYTFGGFENTQYRDWWWVDMVGVDAKAHCLTGFATAGDSAVPKQVPYLVMHFERTERLVDSNFVPYNQSGCLARAQWSWANGIQSNKWTPLMQMYRERKPFYPSELNRNYDNGFTVVTSKTKIRGRGPAIALYFETEPYKDLRLLGWSLTINANNTT